MEGAGGRLTVFMSGGAGYGYTFVGRSKCHIG